MGQGKWAVFLLYYCLFVNNRIKVWRVLTILQKSDTANDTILRYNWRLFFGLFYDNFWWIWLCGG